MIRRVTSLDQMLGASALAEEEAVINVRWFALLAAMTSLWPIGAAAAPVLFDGHYYEYVAADQVTWSQAYAAASSLSYAGYQGRLATITSAEENAFVTDLLPQVVAQGNEVDQAAWLGGIRLGTSSDVTQGWTWITGEPWSYTAWAPGEPNLIDENVLAMWMADVGGIRVRGTWNNGTDSPTLIAGYVVEYAPEPELPLLTGLGVLVLALAARRG